MMCRSRKKFISLCVALSAKFFMRIFSYVIFLLSIASLFACSSGEHYKKSISIHLVASLNVNPDANGRASPIAITLYQLTGVSSFKSANYVSLTENTEAVLGRNLVAINKLILRPGQAVDVEYPVVDGEAAFGIVAGYRVIKASDWQLIYEYPQKNGGLMDRLGGKKVTYLNVLLEENNIQFDLSGHDH
jgi:type VI secretion system protein VasD